MDDEVDGGPFAGLVAAWHEAFVLAWDSWCAGSLGIGAVVADSEGLILSRGRNRVLEEPSTGRLAGSLLGHAEMDAFAGLGLRGADGLTLYTTVEPCLMCSATSISMRTGHIAYAAADPVFDGLGQVLATHPYMENRLPTRQALGRPLLAGFATLLPLANRAWSRPGSPPRREWVLEHQDLWDAATRLVEDGTLWGLQVKKAGVDEAIEVVAPLLESIRPASSDRG